MVFKKKGSFEVKKYRKEIIVGLIVTILGGATVTIFQFMLPEKNVPVVQDKRFPINLRELYTLDKYEIQDVANRDSAWDYNCGTKMAGFYLTSFFNGYTGIKKRIDVKKDEYFCNSYDMKSIVYASGISIHNPNIEQHHSVKTDYYNGTIKDGFAYYNPEIIKWATENLIPDPHEKNIQEILFQDIYNELYRNNIRLIAECYLYFADEQSYKAAQQDYILSMEKDGFNGPTYLFEKYGGKGDYEILFGKPMAIGFWIRRGIDGTNDEIWQAICRILKVYDKNWFNENILTDKEIFRNS